MPDTTAVTATDDLRTIDTDLPCAICGYNLKGLSADASCPECGQDIGRTLTPDLIKSDPVWLRRQAGAMLLMAGLALSNFQPYRGMMGGLFQVWVSLAIMATLVGVWGCWRLAVPEPPGSPSDGEASLQRALRFVPCVYASVLTWSLVNDGVGRMFWGSVGLTAMISLVVTNVLVAWFVYRLARRSNDHSLIRHARIALWTFPLTQCGFIVLNLIAMTWRTSDALNAWFFAISSVMSYLLGAAVYLMLLLLGRMHEALRAAAHLAEARLRASPATTVVSSAP